MTIGQLLSNGVLFLNGRENAQLDCEVILSFVLGVEKEHLLSHDSDEVEDAMRDLFLQYLDRVKDGEPIAYITNQKEFYDLDFYVDKRVLIPRPETEQIVDRVLEYLSGIDGESFKVLDVGTGSGNIAVALAKNFMGLEVDAVDVDESALEVAKMNAEQQGVDDRVSFYQSDLLEMVEKDYDVIVANLPYIGERKHRYVSAATEKYEPGVALFGGEDGLGLYKKMFQEFEERGVSFDYMIGEFGFAQSEDMGELLSSFFDQKWSIVEDLAGIDRLFIVKKG